MSIRRRNCIHRMSSRGGAPRPCNRKVIWLISYLGPFCNFHFEEYLTTHTVDPADITRLSDDESDFVIKSEPGKGHGGNRHATHEEITR